MRLAKPVFRDAFRPFRLARRDHQKLTEFRELGGQVSLGAVEFLAEANQLLVKSSHVGAKVRPHKFPIPHRDFIRLSDVFVHVRALMRGGFELLHARLEVSIVSLERADAAIELLEGDRDHGFDLGELAGQTLIDAINLPIQDADALCHRLYLAAKVVGYYSEVTFRLFELLIDLCVEPRFDVLNARFDLLKTRVYIREAASHLFVNLREAAPHLFSQTTNQLFNVFVHERNGTSEFSQARVNARIRAALGETEGQRCRPQGNLCGQGVA
jgi:hypothetical protein